MAVAFDAKTSTYKNVTGVSTLTVTNMTVGASANALILIMQWLLGAGPGTVTPTWDSGGTNQVMTLISGTTSNNGSSSCATAMYGLLAPTSGNKNLVVSWTGGAVEAHAVAISFTGVDQTSVAVAFPHGTATNNTASTASPASTGAITSATGNMVVGSFSEQSSAWGTISGTTLAKDDATGPALAVASNYASGAATVTLTAAFSGSDKWVAFGCDVLAANVATKSPNNLIAVRQSIVRASNW